MKSFFLFYWNTWTKTQDIWNLFNDTKMQVTTTNINNWATNLKLNERKIHIDIKLKIKNDHKHYLKPGTTDCLFGFKIGSFLRFKRAKQNCFNSVELRRNSGLNNCPQKRSTSPGNRKASNNYIAGAGKPSSKWLMSKMGRTAKQGFLRAWADEKVDSLEGKNKRSVQACHRPLVSQHRCRPWVRQRSRSSSSCRPVLPWFWSQSRCAWSLWATLADRIQFRWRGISRWFSCRRRCMIQGPEEWKKTLACACTW